MVKNLEVVEEECGSVVMKKCKNHKKFVPVPVEKLRALSTFPWLLAYLDCLLLDLAVN